MSQEFKLSFTAAEIDEKLGKVDQFSNEIGDLTALETTEQSNLVAAINEVKTFCKDSIEESIILALNTEV